MDEEKDILENEDHADEHEPDEEIDDTELDESEEESDQDEGEEEGSEEQEVWESEEEFLKQHNLPGSPKSIDDVIVGYKEAIRQMSALQREAADRKAMPEQAKPQTQEDAGRSVYKTAPVSTYLKSLEERGQIDAETAKSVRSWASTIDNANEANWNKVEEIQTSLARAIDRIAKQIRKQSWSSFSHRDLVRKEDLDQLMDSAGFLDYHEALTFKAAQDPELFAKFAAKQQKIGEEKGRKKQGKKLGRFSGPRRSGPPSTSEKVWKNYTIKGTNDLDERKLNQVSMEKRKKIVDAHWKDNFERKK